MQYVTDEFLAQLSPNGRWLVFASKGPSVYADVSDALDEEDETVRRS